MSGGTRSRQATIGMWLLLFIAAFWGLTFFSTKSLLNRMPVTDFLTVRFGLATLLLIVVSPKSLRMPKPVLCKGAVIGVVFAAAELTQTFGLPHTSASISGFITGLYVVFTPLLGAAMFRARLRPLVWGAVGLATVGLAVLSMRPSGAPLGFGEWVTLVSAVLWGLHITLVGRWSAPGDAMSLTITQTGVASVIFLVGGLRDGLTLPQNSVDWIWMAYFAIIVGAVSEFAQIWAQAHVEATKAAILMVTEPLWASLFAVLFGGESVTWRLLTGGALMVAAMAMAVLAHGAQAEVAGAEGHGAPVDRGPTYPSTRAGVAPARTVTPGATAGATSASPIGPNS